MASKGIAVKGENNKKDGAPLDSGKTAKSTTGQSNMATSLNTATDTTPLVSNSSGSPHNNQHYISDKYSAKIGYGDRRLGILGTGDMAAALAQRAAAVGIQVTMGSRQPHRTPRFLLSLSEPQRQAMGDGIRVTSIRQCVTDNDVIVVALHADHFRGVFGSGDMRSLCEGKVLVDLSNRESELNDNIYKEISDSTKTSTSPQYPSNAHLLAALSPGACVVKAFNTVSAYVMAAGVFSGETGQLVPV